MNQEYKPNFFSEAEIGEIKAKHANHTYIDAFSRQVKELFFIDNHSFIGSDKGQTYQTDEFKKYLEKHKDNYVYIHYPWNNHIVRCIKEDDYIILKTNRNQDLITAEEQKRLYSYKVAVLGMSVGSNIAFVLTQAGISREITIADFDELDTTNLNRILAGVHQVGVNKTIVAARRIYEDNPFAEVNLLSEGVNETNLEELIRQGKINCIVEEIDDMPFKIHARQLALKYKIPVVMVTDNGDGVVLHVERYDLGYDKIWGKEIDYYLETLNAGPVTKEVAGKMIIGDIVGGPHRVDPRMMQSVPKVLNKELVSWPQLGSAAILGGVVATVAIKNIVNDTDKNLETRSHIFPHKIDHGSHHS
jgi:molybdopterin/thiamine biosynthesis adenylyltransferase